MFSSSTGEPVFPHVFRVAHQEMFTWRGPGRWLADVIDVAGIRDAVVIEENLGPDMAWDVLVVGTAHALSVVCALFNQHAEQGPDDPTPPAQAERLDALVAGGVAGEWCFVPVFYPDRPGYVLGVASRGQSSPVAVDNGEEVWALGEEVDGAKAACRQANALLGFTGTEPEPMPAADEPPGDRPTIVWTTLRPRR